MRDAIIGATGLILVAFSLFGGVDSPMSIASGAVGLLLCFAVAT